MVENFGNVAKTYTVRTVSVYQARPGDCGYSVGNALFPVEADGRVTLPDALGQQLGLQRIGRHERIEGFDVDEATGVLTIRYYPGREPQPAPPAAQEPAGEAIAAEAEGAVAPPDEPQAAPPTSAPAESEASNADTSEPQDQEQPAAVTPDPPSMSSPAKPSGRRGR